MAAHEGTSKPTFPPKVAAAAASVRLPCLKWRRPLASPPDAQILRQLKTVMCSSDVKWKRGQVNHRVTEIKDDGRTAVWKRWVVVRGRLDLTATFLFLADKGVLVYALISLPPSLFCALYLFLYSVFHLLPPVFACAVQQWEKRVWAPQPPRGATQKCQTHIIHLGEFVSLRGIRPCGSFKPLFTETRLQRGQWQVETKCACMLCCVFTPGTSKPRLLGSFAAHGPDSRLAILLDLALPFYVWPHVLYNLFLFFHLKFIQSHNNI